MEKFKTFFKEAILLTCFKVNAAMQNITAFYHVKLHFFPLIKLIIYKAHSLRNKHNDCLKVPEAKPEQVFAYSLFFTLVTCTCQTNFVANNNPLLKPARLRNFALP